MPGKQDRNLRRAYLQEELGIFLLRGLAAVAPVPRPDDVGIDAVATLLRADSPRNAIAEHSFYVQLKAASIKKMRFRNLEISWLNALRLPYFIGSVDLKCSCISLYSAHKYFDATVGAPTDDIELCLEPAEPTVSKRRQWLGPPVLTWSAADLTDQTIIANSYTVLSSWVTKEQENIRLRQYRFFNRLAWSTNLPPTVDGRTMVGRSIDATLRDIAPHLIMWGHYCIDEKLTDAFSQIAGIVRLMREHGHDPDPLHSLQSYAELKIPTRR